MEGFILATYFTLIPVPSQ